MSWNRIALTVFAATMLALCAFQPPGAAQQIPAEYQKVLDTLGRKGDFKDGVLKVNIPRTDLKTSIAGTTTPTPFGFGGWVAMEKDAAGKEILMGDLVLLQEEVNPVMSALLDHGIEVTALHNHFFWEEPRVFYMHVHGQGSAAALGEALKPALDLIGHVSPTQPETISGSGGTPIDPAKISAIVGHPGEQTGAVYKITVGREDLKLSDHGAPINARMGLNTWAAFYGTQEKAEIAGDVAMRESEVTAVLKSLRSHGLQVVAIHHHMTGLQPMVIFLHYWGIGPVEQLAAGFKAALDQLGSRKER